MKRCDECLESKIVYQTKFVPVMIKCRVDGKIKGAGCFCNKK